MLWDTWASTASTTSIVASVDTLPRFFGCANSEALASRFRALALTKLQLVLTLKTCFLLCGLPLKSCESPAASS